MLIWFYQEFIRITGNTLEITKQILRILYGNTKEIQKKYNGSTIEILWHQRMKYVKTNIEFVMEMLTQYDWNTTEVLSK